jgi:hypothetical protein
MLFNQSFRDANVAILIMLCQHETPLTLINMRPNNRKYRHSVEFMCLIMAVMLHVGSIGNNS